MTLLAALIYGVGTLIFVIFSIVIVYHLRQYGFIGDATKFMIGIFIIVGLLLIVSSSIFVARTDWGKLSIGNFGPERSTEINSQTPIFGGSQ